MTYDEELLRELLVFSQKGDQKKYKEFLNSLLPLISAKVYRKVINKDDVSDVIQDVLLSIHKSLPSYDPKRAVLPWVSTITERRIVDYIRKVTTRNKNEQLTSDGDVTFFEDETKLVNEGVQFLDKLPTDTKRAIILTKIEGHSTKEAALILGINENALRTKVSRGMTKLKKNAKLGLIDYE